MMDCVLRIESRLPRPTHPRQAQIIPFFQVGLAVMGRSLPGQVLVAWEDMLQLRCSFVRCEFPKKHDEAVTNQSFNNH